MKGLALKAFRVKNFKAVRDSKTIMFAPLTVFIGNNGSGKSSIIEGLETLQSIVMQGLDGAMEPWKGMEHIVHKDAMRTGDSSGRPLLLSSPLYFYLKASDYKARLKINAGEGFNDIFIEHEEYYSQGVEAIRDKTGKVKYEKGTAPLKRVVREFDSDDSMIGFMEYKKISSWQFLTLVPQFMVSPKPQRRAVTEIRLEKDGSNLAEYLLHIKKKDIAAFDGILEALQYVLPYADDLQPSITSELERNVYLQMVEGDFKLPGWLLSTGTLRFVAIIALLRNPEPPPLIVIEEIENGLDPRTINLLVEELRNAVQAGRTQVIITTHSPYLLDLLQLSQIVLVERDGKNHPVFSRPVDQKELKEWSKTFTPGKLYTMNRLGKMNK